MEEVMKNPWKPLPIYEIKNGETKTIKENENLDPLQFEVSVTNSTNSTGKSLTIEYDANVTEEDIFKMKFPIKG